MPTVVTIDRPNVVTMIATAARRLTGGNKTEAVAMAMHQLLERHARPSSLFGAHPGSVRISVGVDLLQDQIEAETDGERGH